MGIHSCTSTCHAWRNQVVTGGNVLPKLPNTSEHRRHSMFLKVAATTSGVTGPGSRTRYSRVTHPVYVIYSCKHTPF